MDLPCTNITGVYLGNVKIIVVLRAILINKFQFADMFGVSRQAVSKWEPDNGYPETNKLIVLLYYQTLYWWSKRTGIRI